jgi:pimeloyl-ACP methyl ester carboxylesterase
VTVVERAGLVVDEPVYFPAGAEMLFGVHTAPAVESGAPAIVIVSGGLTGTSTVGRNQMYVSLARAAAADGHRSLRFDYHGIGESTGVLDEFSLESDGPFVDDIVGAGSWLLDRGAERFVLLGKCFGSRMTLGAVPWFEGRLDGVVLIGPPVLDFGRGEKVVARLAVQLSVGDYVRRAVRPAVIANLRSAKHRAGYARAARAKWRALRAPGERSGDGGAAVSRRFIEPLRRLIEAGVPVQLIYGVDDEFYADFCRASEAGPLARLLHDAGDLVEVTEVTGLVRGFASETGQEAIIEAARDWLRRRRASG